ncbi:MAG: EAL domain-containing protein [Pseudomonadota bacterium]
MLRKRLNFQIVALAASAVIAASLTVWSGLSMHRATISQAEIDQLRTAAQELEINIQEQSFSIIAYLIKTSPALLERMQADEKNAAKALSRLRQGDAILAPETLGHLASRHTQLSATLTELVDLAQRKQAFLVQLIESTDRIDVLLSEEQIPRITQNSPARLYPVAKMEIKLAKVIRDLGLYLRNSNEEHRVEFEQSLALYAQWAADYRKLISHPTERSWLDALSVEVVQVEAAARKISVLAGTKFAAIDKLKGLEEELDAILDHRIQAELQTQHHATVTLQNRAFAAAAGSVALLLLVMTAAVMVMSRIRRRLTSGLQPLLALAERIGAGDMTSTVESGNTSDEFQRVTESFMLMRSQLRRNTVSFDRLDAILDRLGSLRILVGTDGVIREVSDAVVQTLGSEAAEFAGSPISRLLGREMDFHTLHQLIKQGLLHKQTWALRNNTGASVPVTMTGLDLTDELLLLGMPAGTGLSPGAWTQVAEGLVLLDANGVVRRANPAALSILGTDDSAIKDQPLWEVCKQIGSDRFLDADMLADMARKSSTVELSLTQPARGLTQIQAKIAKLEEMDDQPAQFALILRDVTELQRAQEAVRRLAYFDSLTGLVNRGRFHQHLDDAIRAAMRRGERLALLFLDLDGFKDVNDTLGHHQGDCLLQEVGRRLQGQIRDVDVAARLGGDEFCLLLMNVDNNGHTAADVAQRCLEALTEPVVLEGKNIGARGSIGIAVYPADAAEANGLLKAADTAMYAAKNAGKHRFAFYDASMTEIVERRLTLESALRDALKLGEFELHYQPQISLVTGRMSGVEALARWRRPGFGLVSPEEFIGLAEQMGVISALGNWVLDAACRQAAAWQRAGLEGVQMAVNISPSHFESPGFVDIVARMVRDSGINPASLEIEITESITRNPQRHIDACLALQKLGVRIAIDDFGTGYSSLSVLKHMPINTLKLDRQFIHDMALDDASAVMTGTIVGLASGLNLVVVAEGVETIEQVQVLTGLGCKLAQGYYFCRPVPADQIPTFRETNFLDSTAVELTASPVVLEPT